MNGIKLKMLLAVTFAALFLAGGAVGLLAGRSGKDREREPFSLVKDLDLTKDQQDEMRRIWTETMRAARSFERERRGELREWREEAILQLMTDEQLVLYDAIQQEYDKRIDEINEERRELFVKASERSKSILTEKQRELYEDLIEKQGGFLPYRGRGGRSLD